jgi:coenzyme F420-0:L-glutamate ligase/coenzyme F420-1:gamma-L-glutamate ligase
VRAGDDLDGLLCEAAAAAGMAPGDVLVVAHKVVSKAEGRLVALAGVQPGAAALALARETGKDARLCECILAESRRIVRRRRGTLICETHHGFVCANAGIDASNVPEGHLILLPRNPDASARRLQARLAARLGGRVGVVIADTHGRAFRRGLVNVAIGVAGFRGLLDRRGARDREGRVLVATEEALADELAAAAGVLQGKGAGLPAVVISGVATQGAPGDGGELLRDPAHDLFRG